MDELLKKLLAADLLTEETKKELESAVKKQLEEAVTKAKDEAAADVRAQLHEQWINERDALISALDDKVSAFLMTEMKELRDDIERFRDLEAEYAEKLVETKSEMASQLKSDMAQLVEKLDAFLEVRLTAEVDELREDITEVRKNDFGRKIFEAFISEYKKFAADDDSIEGRLNETETKLETTVAKLTETQKELSGLRRAKKLSEVLAPLSGRSREVMEAILKNVNTEQLDEAYKTYIGRVIKESAPTETTKEVIKEAKAAPATPAEKEKAAKSAKVLAEGDKKVTKGVVKSGDKRVELDEQARLEESTPSNTGLNEALEWARKIGGVVRQ